MALTGQPAFSVAPDGSRIVYSAVRGGARQLYERRLDQSEPTPIPGTEGGLAPFFSPDGAWVGFIAGGKLKRVPLGGGAPLTISEVPRASLGAAWRADGTILFNPEWASGLAQVAAAGGTPKVVTSPKVQDGERGHTLPRMLPCGDAALFVLRSAAGAGSRVAVLTLATGEWTALPVNGSDPRYAASGHLLYAREGRLFAVAFDRQRLQVRGPHVQVLEGIVTDGETGVSHYDVSRDGTLIYAQGGPVVRTTTLLWLDSAGREEPLSLPPRLYEDARLSPDARKLAVVVSGQAEGLWVVDLFTKTWTRVTAGPALTPAWTPDVRRVSFSAGDPMNLFWSPADGTAPPVRLTTSDNWQVGASWSADGSHLVFVQSVRGQPMNRDIFLVKGAGEGSTRPLVQTVRDEAFPQLSPDGRLLAYVSKESGSYQIHVQAFPGPYPKRQVSYDGGFLPFWAKDGHDLYFRAQKHVMAARLRRRAVPDFDAPRKVLETSHQVLEAAPDGRFLAVRPGDSSATQLSVVLNWLDELKARIPSPPR
jgi:serine/threonine-protein kinase